MVDAEEAATRERDVPRRLFGEHRGSPRASGAPQAAGPAVHRALAARSGAEARPGPPAPRSLWLPVSAGAVGDAAPGGGDFRGGRGGADTRGPIGARGERPRLGGGPGAPPPAPRLRPWPDLGPETTPHPGSLAPLRDAAPGPSRPCPGHWVRRRGTCGPTKRIGQAQTRVYVTPQASQCRPFPPWLPPSWTTEGNTRWQSCEDGRAQALDTQSEGLRASAKLANRERRAPVPGQHRPLPLRVCLQHPPRE